MNNRDKVCDNFMKKILIIMGICLAVLGLIVIFFINSMKSELTGRWNSITTEDDCFSSISFTDGPPSTRVISIHETNGNHTQVWMGNYKEQSEQLSVELTEPKADPFEMTYNIVDDQLKLQYAWKNEEYSCTYELAE